jgi:hypothetical protein
MFRLFLSENNTQKKVEENLVTNNNEIKEKPKPKRAKITKKVIEDRLIAAYVRDGMLSLCSKTFQIPI